MGQQDPPKIEFTKFERLCLDLFKRLAIEIDLLVSTSLSADRDSCPYRDNDGRCVRYEVRNACSKNRRENDRKD